MAKGLNYLVAETNKPIGTIPLLYIPKAHPAWANKGGTRLLTEIVLQVHGIYRTISVNRHDPPIMPKFNSTLSVNRHDPPILPKVYPTSSRLSVKMSLPSGKGHKEDDDDDQDSFMKKSCMNKMNAEEYYARYL